MDGARGECFFSNGSVLDSGRNVLLVVVDHREWEDAMKTLALKVQRFLTSEDGPTAVEYAVMLALIVIVCLTAIQTIGTNANTTFNSVATKLGS
jgi:pilus assembly protein Flp/PilA